MAKKHKRKALKIPFKLSKLETQKKLGIIFIIVLAALGVYLLGAIHAANPNTSIEAENGSLSGNASKLIDANASGGAAVQFHAPAGTPFITSLSTNKRYLLDQNGNPFLINGDTPWALAWKLNSTDQDYYLANREANGFNLVVTDLVGSPGTMTGNPGGANWNGELPFTGSNFTPNPTYWARIDTFFNLAKQHGISVMALPIDFYATRNDTGQPQNPFINMTNTQAQAFGTFLAQRYPQSTYPGIVWTLGNDFGGDGVGCCGGGFSSQYMALLTGLSSNGQTRPTTVEEGFLESLSSDGTTVGKAVSVNAEYSYFPTYFSALRGYAVNKGPVFFAEGAYETATTGYPSTPLDLRKQVGWSMTSGETGTLYGNDTLWPYPSGWKNLLNTTIVTQRKVFNAAIAATRWWTTVPDTGNQLVTGGRNNRATNIPIGQTSIQTPKTDDATYGWYVTAAYSPDGKLGLIYNPDSTRNNITLSASVLGTNPTITRVDPTNGAKTNLGWTTNPAGGTNAGGNHDWLYIINAN